MEAGRSRRAAAGLIVAMSVARTPCDAQPALPDLVPVGEPPLSLRVDPALSPWQRSGDRCQHCRAASRGSHQSGRRSPHRELGLPAGTSTVASPAAACWTAVP